ncbi:D-glucuronyl C5-epimerase family protein [Methanococcus voltae]|uniref:D-glucuronyl C5-epimerase domain protein n=1 Tax=Methanococcus voltae (strain ATCC BAA-1334 / A3) TaxID=456320 RepID=D7DRY3_METV3|nr:D-glucuronyl C5-epimerase family protein [Methanococcus voltae]MCS3901418.1 CRISPR/Cas system CSM-associated protein Csm2 small subunit [Methanococcus voltae]
MIGPFPKIVPELDYTSDNLIDVYHNSLKKKVVSRLFHSLIIGDDGSIYMLSRKTGELHYQHLANMTLALVCYNDYLRTNDKKYLEGLYREFNKLMDCIEINETIDSDNNVKKIAGWKLGYGVHLKGYPEPKRSFSALSLGRALNLMIRYYQLKPSEDVENLIEYVLNSFETLSDDGGVLKEEKNTDGTINTWYLEYSYGKDSPVVYNGFLSALIGLYETSKYGPEAIREKAKVLFDKGFNTLLNNIDNIAYNGKHLQWLRYDNNLLFFADGDYVDIKLKQLNYLYEKTNNPKIKETIELWEKIRKDNKFRASIFEWVNYLYKKGIINLKS